MRGQRDADAAGNDANAVEEQGIADRCQRSHQGRLDVGNHLRRDGIRIGRPLFFQRVADAQTQTGHTGIAVKELGIAQHRFPAQVFLSGVDFVKNREQAERLNKESDELIAEAGRLQEKIYTGVLAKIR